MQNIDFLIFRELSHSPSHTRSKAFASVCLVSHCISSANNVLHLCMPACATSKKEWLLSHLKKKEKWIVLAAAGEKKKEKGKPDREEKRTLFCPLAFVSGVVDVFFCGSVRMYVTQTSSIFVLSLFFFSFFSPPDHTSTHTYTHTENVSWSVAG